jgi:threonine dehydratase
MLDLESIKEAAVRVKPYVKRTPLERSESLSRRLGVNVFVKYELFQRTGSFKPRGAFNKMLSLSEGERKRGVIAVSGGNHAQAVAYAATTLGIDAVVLMPENTPKNYLDAARGYGANVDLQPNIAAAFDKIAEYEAQGRVLVHPFDDELVIAGQGTVGLEIVEDVPDVTDVIASIGGGGMAAGVAMAVKSLKPEVKAWGVETIGADAMSQAIAAGEPVMLPGITSVAKTLGAPAVTDLTLQLAQQYLESVTVVPDPEAIAAQVYILERLKVLTEPASSCTFAAAERLRANFGPDTNLVLVFCGGNSSVVDICAYI